MIDSGTEKKSAEELEETDLQQFAELLRFAGPRSEVPEASQLRVREAVRKQWIRELRVRRTRRMAAAAIASLAAAASILAFLGRPIPLSDSETHLHLAPQMASIERSLGNVRILRSTDRKERPLSPLRVGDTLETGNSGRAALKLTSGQSLRVDLDSILRFASEDRVVLEKGAIYLDLDPSISAYSPVDVQTSMGTIRHLGTQFEVQIDERRLRLRMREGFATVDRDDLSLDVEAGIELTLNAQGVTEESVISPHDEAWSWTQEIAPAFDLEGETLSEFLDWTEREIGWSVRLDSDLQDSASKVVLHGSIDGMSPMEAVRAVLPTCEVHFRIEDGWLVVTRL